MRLRDLEAIIQLDIVRDAEFNALGLLSSSTPSTLACFYDRKFAYEFRRNRNLAAVIAGPEVAASVPLHLGLVTADDPRNRFYEVHRHLGSQTDFYGRDFPSEISPEAQVHPRAYAAPRKVRIGHRCHVEPGAMVLEGTTLEEDVVIRAGAVIAAEGFHPTPYNGKLANLPHYGSVVIHRGAEVQSNAVICRSVFQSVTEIGEETKIGPLAYVAHGVKIGTRCRIASSARICGSSIIGSEVSVGPNAVVSNRLRVGDGARISLGSVVVSDVAPGQTVTGNFAIDHARFLSFYKGMLK